MSSTLSLPSRAALLALAWFGAAAAVRAEEPFHFKVARPGQPTMEVMVEAGEAAEIRGPDGEVLVLQLRAVADRVTAAVEISRGGAEKARLETLEVAVGEKATSRALARPLEIELLGGPFAEVETRPAPTERTRFEVELQVPGGRGVMAVAGLGDGELIRLRNRKLGFELGFRPALQKGSAPLAVEIYRILRGGDGHEQLRFVHRAPLGQDFSLSAEELGMSPGTAPLQGHVRLADPAMWDNMATAGGLDSIVELRARWAGGRWITGQAYGGELFRVQHASLGGEIGFAPVAPSDDSVTLNVFRVRRGEGGEALELLETLTVTRGSTGRVVSAPVSLEVELLGAHPPLVRSCWLGCGQGSGHGCAVACGDTGCCTGPCCRY